MKQQAREAVLARGEHPQHGESLEEKHRHARAALEHYRQAAKDGW